MGIETKCGQPLFIRRIYDDSASLSKWQKMGVLATEMEAAALHERCKSRKECSCHSTISDNPFTGEATTAEERQNTFTAMMKIALEIA